MKISINVNTKESNPNLYRIMWDDELWEYNYKSRTASPNWDGYDCTPDVFEYGVQLFDPMGDTRVDITDLDNQIRRINNYNNDAVNYLYAGNTALFNGNTYPRQQMVTMSGNIVEVVGFATNNLGQRFAKIKAVKIGDDVHNMNFETHPQYIHRFAIVCWKKDPITGGYTSHTNMTPKGEVFYFLVTASPDGYAYIQDRYLTKV